MFLAGFTNKSTLGLYKLSVDESKQLAMEISRLEITANGTNELLFHIMETIMNMSEFNQNGYLVAIKNMVQLLKTKGDNPDSLFKTFLFIFLLHSQDSRHVPDTANPTHDTLEAPKQFLNGLFDAFTQDQDLKQRTEILERFMVFAAQLLLRHAKLTRKQKIEPRAIQQAAKSYVFFAAKVVSSLQENFSARIYYAVAVLLADLLQVSVANDEMAIKQSLEKFFIRFDLKNKKIFTAITLAYLTMLSIVSKGVISAMILNTYSEFEPTWIDHLLTVRHSLTGKNVLLISLQYLASKEYAEKSLKSLSSILNLLMDKRDIELPEDFLQEIAEWQLNFQKRAALSDEVKTLLGVIYNQCIHKTQGTHQEKTFEAIRTALLMRYDADPSNDPQAIHTRENHDFAEKIHDAWTGNFGTTDEEGAVKIKKGWEQFKSYMMDSKLAEVRQLTAFKEIGKANNYIADSYGDTSVPEAN
ncbi:MAG: hypothetical protein ACRCXC_08460 [Legionella sp.]